ncbi:MAG TPA: cyclopropane-fatty-acyl-phospholipid synthase family protein [Candidatus Sulfotelmatobacter sp.]|jgi:cyclopropane-fatty-acyl-phospholipid synthase|nr:cyclopropane-fatty-acyl-phospholipid synthase family protein [Candidatus Sulfotelmatobacter sp.]
MSAPINAMTLLSWGLRRLIRKGQLVLIGPDGHHHTIGADGQTPRAVARITDPKLPLRLVLNGDYHLGQGYMDGGFVMEEGTIRDFLEVVNLNMGMESATGLKSIPYRLELLTSYLMQFNPLGRSRANVAHHYDLSEALYSRFLDEDWQYSCAYFENPEGPLEQAQLAKKRHIAAKLGLKPGMKVLDIGSGWGGMAIYLAKVAGVDVTGITLSVEQHKKATERAAKAGLSDRVRFLLRDYRHETGTYDRIVSVGMFEHVGVPHYNAFFRKVRDLLTDDGVALIHSIGRVDGPGTTNPWLRKYIFPGGYAPALSEVLPAIERACVYVSDIEILRMHYAWTLRHWADRFAAARADIAANLYDERFCRMWEFYLAASEMDFAHTGTMVFQVQLCKAIDAVPFTRDYMFEAERTLKAAEE